MENLLPVVELFKKSFDAYWKKVWTLAGIVLFGFISFVVISPFVLAGVLISYKPFSRNDFSLNLILIDILLGLIALFFCIMFSFWSRVALFFAVKEDGVGVGKSLATGWKNIWPFFWISLLAGLAVLGGFILLIIPGIIFAVWFCLSIYVFISEGLRGTAALKRSKQLVKGFWWPVFGRIVVIMIIALLISWIKFFGPIINIFFMVPFSVVYVFELYQDVKRVKSNQ